MPQNHFLHRLDRVIDWCRYVGWLRCTLQAYLTALVRNLKRLVRLLTGVPFRGRAPAVA